MPKTLNPVNTFPASIPNFPLAGNNEPVAIGPLEAAFQNLLNRTESLHQSRLTVEGAGVKRVQRVSSLSALSSLGGMADLDVVGVDGYGLYRLFNPSALTADGLWILTATGGGRWVHTSYQMRGIANGWAMLDSGGRLAQDVRDSSILTQHIANNQITASKIADSQITAAKLAPGAAISNIGYTPVNQAGDTVVGPLITTGRIFAHRQFGAGPPSISLALGDDDTGLDWAGDGTVRVIANNTILASWTAAALGFAPGKQIDFAEDTGCKINFRPNIPESKAKINAVSGYLGQEFNATYNFVQWYLSSGFAPTNLPNTWAVPGDILGTSHISHVHARPGLITFYTATSNANVRSFYSRPTIEDNAQFRIEPSQVVVRTRFVPDADNVITWTLGAPGFRWQSVWAANGTIQTSDQRLKTDIQPSPLGLEFVCALTPVSYRWREGGKEAVRKTHTDENGLVHDDVVFVNRPGKRTHYGLIAQDVKAVLERLGAGDFGGWVLDDISDPDSHQSLRYDQFIAPLIRAIQELAERVEELERRKR